MLKLHRALFSAIAIALAFSLSSVALAESTAADVNPKAPAAADASADKARYDAEVTKSKDLPNFHEVHPFLYRSGAPTEAGMKQLKALGVKTVIDLRGGDKSKQEADWAKEVGIKYINLPMSSAAPTRKQVNTFLHTVESAEADKNNGAVLVHCQHGSDRTGCMVGIWRVKHDGYSYDQAYKEMRHYWFSPKFTNLSGTVKKYASK